MPQENEKQPSAKPLQRSGLIGLLQTVMGAIFGIQSDRKRREDFAEADPGKLIMIGIVSVTLMIFGMVALVNSVLHASGR